MFVLVSEATNVFIRLGCWPMIMKDYNDCLDCDDDDDCQIYWVKVQGGRV